MATGNAEIDQNWNPSIIAVSAVDGVTPVRLEADPMTGELLVTATSGTLGLLVDGTASNTDGTSTAVMAAQGTGVRTYLTDFTIANTSANNIYVELKDGSVTRWVCPVPANGGITCRFESPLAGTANTAWNFDPSAATTTVYCSMAGFKQ